MTSFELPRSRRVLADVLPGGVLRDAVLVGGSATLVGLSAQVAIPLPFTPVPLSGQTFAVLLASAALGPTRAAAAMLLYALAGVLGVPWFASHHGGWASASFGYVLGFVAAALVVGGLARRGADRTPLRTAGLMVVGNLVIYVAGVWWLTGWAGSTVTRAVTLGVVPFLPGDVFKIGLATALLPAAWCLVRRGRQDGW